MIACVSFLWCDASFRWQFRSGAQIDRLAIGWLLEFVLKVLSLSGEWWWCLVMDRVAALCDQISFYFSEILKYMYRCPTHCSTSVIQAAIHCRSVLRFVNNNCVYCCLTKVLSTAYLQNKWHQQNTNRWRILSMSGAQVRSNTSRDGRRGSTGAQRPQTHLLCTKTARSDIYNFGETRAHATTQIIDLLL